MIETSEAIEAIDVSNKKAWDMVRSNPSETLAIAQKNLERSEELGYEKGIAWSKGNIGAACTWLAEYEKAIEFSYQAVDLLKSCGEFAQEVQIEYYLFIVFHLLGDEEKQLEHVKKSLERAKGIGDLFGQANALNGIGTIHYTFNRPEEAIGILEQALAIAIELDNAALLGRVYNGISTSYIGLQQYEKALKTMEEALVFVQRSGEKQALSYCHKTGRLSQITGALQHFFQGTRRNGVPRWYGNQQDPDGRNLPVSRGQPFCCSKL